MKTRTVTLALPAALYALLSLAGCSSGVAGEYACHTPMAEMRLTPQSGGKATSAATLFGQSIEKAGTYEVAGDRLTVAIDGGSQVFAIAGDKLDGGFVQCTRK